MKKQENSKRGPAATHPVSPVSPVSPIPLAKEEQEAVRGACADLDAALDEVGRVAREVRQARAVEDHASVFLGEEANRALGKKIMALLEAEGALADAAGKAQALQAALGHLADGIVRAHGIDPDAGIRWNINLDRMMIERLPGA